LTEVYINTSKKLTRVICLIKNLKKIKVLSYHPLPFNKSIFITNLVGICFTIFLK